MGKYTLTLLSVLAGFLFLGSVTSIADTEIMDLPITSAEDIVSNGTAQIDPSNENALLVNSSGKTVVELFNLEGSGLGDKKLTYSARIRSEDLKATEGTRGIAYLELTVTFPDGGELVADGPRVPISGTTQWRSADTDLYVDKGGDPESVTLDLIVEGQGKVWVSDVRLSTRPLRTDYLFWGHVVVWIVLIIYIYHLVRKQSVLARELRTLKGGV